MKENPKEVKALWQAGLHEYDEVQGIQWEWQAVDGVMTKAPFGKGATGPNPTDRAKSGTKRSMLTDGAGIPLPLVVDGANRHDCKLLGATLDGIVIARPEPDKAHLQHLCLDTTGYDYLVMRLLVRARGYLDHVRSRGEEKAEKIHIPGHLWKRNHRSFPAPRRPSGVQKKKENLPDPVFYEDDERSARGEQIAQRPAFKKLLDNIIN